MFIYHIKKIELEANLPVQMIRSFKGTEFKNVVMNDLFTEKRISRQNIQPLELHIKWSSRKEVSNLD